MTRVAKASHRCRLETCCAAISRTLPTYWGQSEQQVSIPLTWLSAAFADTTAYQASLYKLYKVTASLIQDSGPRKVQHTLLKLLQRGASVAKHDKPGNRTDSTRSGFKFPDSQKQDKSG